MTLKRIMYNSYVQNWYGHGGTVLAGLGDVARVDFIGTRAQQANEAYKNFGQTDIDKPGVRGVGYPRVSGTYAMKLIAFWRGEADRLQGHAADIPDSAVRSQWLRSVQTLNNGIGITGVVGAARVGGSNLLPDTLVKVMWDTIDPVVLGMNAIKDTPTKWEILKESLPDFASPIAGVMRALKLLGIGAIAYVAYDVFKNQR